MHRLHDVLQIFQTLLKNRIVKNKNIEQKIASLRIGKHRIVKTLHRKNIASLKKTGIVHPYLSLKVRASGWETRRDHSGRLWWKTENILKYWREMLGNN